jgi:eukaryotic-like serine/threonine-protein kinase
VDPSVQSLTTDELTGLNNRRAFFERAATAFGEARAAGLECAAAVIDLDRLDFVNDTYGHHTGTELIRETGAALTAIARDGDVIGRIGGDEFALLRPGAPTSKEELWFQISAVARHASGVDKPFALAVSVGVAVARADEIESLDALMALADDAMYEHKRAGGGSPGPPHARRAARG